MPVNWNGEIFFQRCGAGTAFPGWCFPNAVAPSNICVGALRMKVKQRHPELMQKFVGVFAVGEFGMGVSVAEHTHLGGILRH